MELPIEGSKWSLDGLPVTVDAVKKKGRGYYVEFVYTGGAGNEAVLERKPLKEWERKAKAA